MTTIRIDIDEVPVRIGNQSFEMADASDRDDCGIVNFSVDVEIEPDGRWDITEVYPAVGIDIVAGKMVNKRGKKMTGPFARSTARFLEKFAEARINDEVHDTIMQAPRRHFPKAAVV